MPLKQLNNAVQFWCRLSPAIPHFCVQGLEVPFEQLTRDVLREDVRGILRSQHFPLLESSRHACFLDPEPLGTQVAHFSDAAPLRDTQGCRRIRVNLSSRDHAQIFGVRD